MRRRRRWRRCRSLPTVPACATKVAGESTSEMVSVPLVEMSAARLVSVRLAVADERIAASLVPRILTVTDVRVPSALANREGVGVRWFPPTNSLWAGTRRRSMRRGVDGEGAVAAHGAGLRHEGGGGIDIGDGQRAAGRNVRGQIGLGQVGRPDERIAASLVPRILTVTDVRVPSALATEKGVGVGGSATNSLWAEDAA